MKQSPPIKSINYILQPEFIEWVLRPTQESDLYWENYIIEHPSEKNRIYQSKYFIKDLIPKEKELSEEEILSLWEKIESTSITRNRSLNRIIRWSVAASLLLAIGLSGWFITNQKPERSAGNDYHTIAVKNKAGSEIKLIMSDHSEKVFSSKEVALKYNKEGKLAANSEKTLSEASTNQNVNIGATNELVVPFGKKSSVELADGTKLWLNSGSRAIFPLVFAKDKREIFLEGEGYIEVAHDSVKPFFVVTDHIKVKVLGTKFNLSAYADDASISLALVEGSVEASSETGTIKLLTNQVLSYHKSTHVSSINSDDLLEHISWSYGWMLCDKETILSIITKLSRYYDVKIDVRDPKINHMTLTGKLDLKNNCEDVLKVICTTAPLNYEYHDNQIIINSK